MATASVPETVSPHRQDAETLFDIPDDDLPPPYTYLDENPKSFTIRGTFIWSPSGPCYQLSSTLDQRGLALFLRKLTAREVKRATNPTASALPFDKLTVLYEITCQILGSALEIHGRRRGTIPGLVTMKSGFRTWHIAKHSPGPRDSKQELLSRKLGGDNQHWKDSRGDTIAKESMVAPDTSTAFASLELTKDLTVEMREFLITCWVARLWNAASKEKTKAEGHQVNKKLNLAVM